MPIDDTSKKSDYRGTHIDEWQSFVSEAIAQINRAHINMALESGELEPIIEAIANDE